MLRVRRSFPDLSVFGVSGQSIAIKFAWQEPAVESFPFEFVTTPQDENRRKSASNFKGKQLNDENANG